MNLVENGKRYLITTNAWFYGPDGEQYRAVYGPATLIEAKDSMGFTPQRPSTNWYVRVGSDDRHIILAGCQVHYLLRLDETPRILPGKQPKKEKERPLPINAILLMNEE